MARDTKPLDSDYSDSDVDMDVPFRARVPTLVTLPACRPLAADDVGVEAPPVNLLSLLPPDMWMRLTPAERASLLPTLPDLSGWWGLSSDDAAAENVRQLLAGANVNFGNLLTRFSFPSAARSARIRDERVAFEWARTEYASSITASILSHRAQLLREPMSLDEQALSTPMALPASAPAVIDEIRPSAPSLFLAIRSALHTIPRTASDICDMLLAEHAWTPALDGVNVPELTPRLYIESALVFLSQPIVSTAFAGGAHGWDVPSVAFDPVGETFTWRQDAQDSMDESVRLLHLERLFRSPLTEVDPSLQPHAAILRVARAHKGVPKRPRVEEDSAPTPPAYTFKTAEKTQQTERPSQAMYHAQDRQRYSKPSMPFTYYDMASGHQTSVGPLLPVHGSPVDDASLLVAVPDLPPAASVGWINITRDALARLPPSGGSRADLVALAALSIYVHPSTRIDDVALAVARTLDALSSGPMACARYTYDLESNGHRWVYTVARTN
ncbi:hypothetical protein SDRG_02618 [Saprolegnia diclina VS20]|uniref:Nuclear factor related to kappa-B-binding protein second winged helix domain-containing protein n=1 Tax=Saprolegnia diclina (strain VS20) TaxID=1156394 RepID=T0SB80_SAPDV|nr:hypothetical protein SDRG_02618 [Saprolegnia diclina VS20]EQC39962.1 hypothetical protein SDRG_02618 [Saprolegnia diclina VS20]|eukprot:XP_008606436.1 hypothetical protein SDRG_02618 [Saprolegnia diclina VS20]